MNQRPGKEVANHEHWRSGCRDDAFGLSRQCARRLV